MRSGSDFFKWVLVLALLIDLEFWFLVFGIDLRLVGEEERKKEDFFCGSVSVLAEDEMCSSKESQRQVGC